MWRARAETCGGLYSATPLAQRGAPTAPSQSSCSSLVLRSDRGLGIPMRHGTSSVCAHACAHVTAHLAALGNDRALFSPPCCTVISVLCTPVTSHTHTVVVNYTPGKVTAPRESISPEPLLNAPDIVLGSRGTTWRANQHNGQCVWAVARLSQHGSENRVKAYFVTVFCHRVCCLRTYVVCGLAASPMVAPASSHVVVRHKPIEARQHWRGRCVRSVWWRELPDRPRVVELVANLEASAAC